MNAIEINGYQIADVRELDRHTAWVLADDSEGMEHELILTGRDRHDLARALRS